LSVSHKQSLVTNSQSTVSPAGAVSHSMGAAVTRRCGPGNQSLQHVLRAGAVQAIINPAHAAQRAEPSLPGPVHRGSSGRKIGNQVMQRLLSDGPIQAKLTVNQPGDLFEQEADRMADAVMRMPDPNSSLDMPVSGHSQQIQVQRMCSDCEEEKIQRAPESIQRMCSKCDEEEIQRQPIETEEEKDKKSGLQPKELPGHTNEVTRDAQDQINALRSGGHSLPDSERAFFETRFGSDFGQVRLHTDSGAAKAARMVNARAFTVGRNVVLGAGEYAPGTIAGRRLLAHELTHVIQQGAVNTLHGDQRVQRQAAPDLEPLSGNQSGPGPSGNGGAGASGCPATPTGLGNVAPNPPCAKKPSRDIGAQGQRFHFCRDSAQLIAEDAGGVKAFVATQPRDAQYIVHGYASVDGARAYNDALACHRANAMAALLQEAGVAQSEIIEIASKGPTREFGGDAAANQVAVALAETPPERRFGQFRPDPKCPATPTNLGNVHPDPPCPEEPRDVGSECINLNTTDPARGVRECDSYHFCLDSDIFLFETTPGSVMKFARKQPSKAHFTVHGYASDEGPHIRDYNFRLACHRANRVARELMKAGVPPEQIDIATKGPTSQFPGPPEANRVAVVRATPPTVGPTPSINAPKTQQEKHDLLDAALNQIDQGGYRLEADAYISFWTCARVPNLRHAVHTMKFYAEGDSGTPQLNPPDVEQGAVSIGEAGGRLGINAAIIRNDIFATANLDCVMAAMAALSFSEKVRDEDLGAARGRSSDNGKASVFFAFLAGFECVREFTEDPVKDKPAPKCTVIPPPTFKGKAAPGEAGVKPPTFRVDSATFRGSSGSTTFLFPVGNTGSMETSEGALSANANVSLQGQPMQFGNYEIGYVLTRTSDETISRYAGGEEIAKRLPSPIRDTDGFKPTEPWFSDGSFAQAKSGKVSVSMSKTFAEVIALRHQELDNPKAPLGSALSDATRHGEMQLWLVARRRGAPLDRFGTHFLSGARVELDQNLTMKAGAVSGDFKVSVPVTGGDERLVRFTGPTPEDLGAKETTTTDVIPPCARAFGSVLFDVNRNTRAASGVTDVIAITRTTPPSATFSVVALGPKNDDSHVKYSPSITMTIRDAKAPADKFEVGLIQNLLSQDERYQYSGGAIVHGVCTQDMPIRDGATDTKNTDPVFMSNHEPELAKLSSLRRAATLKLTDSPGMGAIFNLATHPLCPGSKSGVLERMVGKSKFRTWVAARFNGDAGCMQRFHHIDWQINHDATVGADATKDKVVTGAMEVTVADGDGSPAPTISGGLANDLCRGDDSCG